MNSIQINADGTITISQETAEERVRMAKHYAEMERPADAFSPNDTGESEAFDRGFKGGWVAAVQESQLRFVNGQLLDFYAEQGTPSYTMEGVSLVDLEQAAPQFEDIYGKQDPHYNEPEGTGELTMEGEEAWDEEPRETLSGKMDYPEALVDQYLSGSVTGEPLPTQDQSNFMSVQEWGKVKEEAFRDTHGAEMNPRTSQGPVSTARPDESIPAEDPEYVEPGTWTLSSEELQSRINEAHERGYQEGFSNGQTVAERQQQITRRTLEMKARELIAQDTLANFAKGEGAPTRLDIIFGESMEAFVIPFAKSLGFKVVD